MGRQLVTYRGLWAVQAPEIGHQLSKHLESNHPLASIEASAFKTSFHPRTTEIEYVLDDMELEKTLANRIKGFCSTCDKKWKAASRSRSKFVDTNRSWMQRNFNVPMSISIPAERIPEPESSTSGVGRFTKEFASSSGQEESLALVMDCRMSKDAYKKMRMGSKHHNAANLYPSYDGIIEAKKRCYSSGVELNKYGASVPLQNLLNHTVMRLIKSIELPDDGNPSFSQNRLNLEVWMQSSSGHSDYMQLPETEEHKRNDGFDTEIAPTMRGATEEQLDQLAARKKDIQNRLWRELRIRVDKVVQGGGTYPFAKMDVRKFLKRKVNPDPAEPCSLNAKIPNFDSSIVARDHDETNSNDLTALLKLNSADLESYIERFSLISNEMRKHVDIEKKSFRYDWFEQYEWLIYSEKLKRALCKFYVLFRPTVKKSYLSASIFKVFTNYKDFHECSRNHLANQWHREATAKAFNFVINIIDNKSTSVVDQLNITKREIIKSNRESLMPIISSIIFCGTHDLLLREKIIENFESLLDFRVESGDQVLSSHLKNYQKNAKYTSHQIISICEEVLRDEIVNEVNKSVAFSLLADESADIVGKEQLSLGVRFVYFKNIVKEEFLGFAELSIMNAKRISDAILQSCESYGLNMNLLVGRGFDGRATMPGCGNGVQRIIRNKYNKATYFYSGSHKLNLVVNDLNSVSEIQNGIGTIKEAIKFFKENPNRRRLVPNVFLFCETRWSVKCETYAKEFDLNFKTPRVTTYQTQQENHKTKTAEEYFRVSMYMPYLDSLILSLNIRLSNDLSDEFLLSALHRPQLNAGYVQFKEKVDVLAKKYDIGNLKEEADTRAGLWKEKNINSEMDVFEALTIFLSMPPTTATIEIWFSTLRRVKWLRSTVTEDRLYVYVKCTQRRNT
ncbi:hypothetical protein ILUMI_09304 [Ignelater luminosus]|uniref:DUF4371 domain-containing protein n=1 Tax=Ignelater luminosus TaxID=2038154 RepID=A0A8K0D4I4_IGNLU|nr:hypothetical protein ILUMI_09304 [Ignelater luminosus]